MYTQQLSLVHDSASIEIAFIAEKDFSKENQCQEWFQNGNGIQKEEFRPKDTIDRMTLFLKHHFSQCRRPMS